MALIVAKFGGTSVASPERIKNVAKRLVGMRQRGDEVVAVVSAMGKTTDELMGLASAITTAPPARELDRLPTKTPENHSRKYTNFYYKKANCYKTF